MMIKRTETGIYYLHPYFACLTNAKRDSDISAKVGESL